MMSSSPMDRAMSPIQKSSPSFSSISSMISPSPAKQVKLEIPTENPTPEPSKLYDLPPIPPPKELHDYLWPRPPHYHLLWPGRPLPVLPTSKDGQPADFTDVFPRAPQEPFFGLFFSNNNLSRQNKARSEQKREDAISQFMDGPFFRLTTSTIVNLYKRNAFVQAWLQRIRISTIQEGRKFRFE